MKAAPAAAVDLPSSGVFTDMMCCQSIRGVAHGCVSATTGVITYGSV